MRGRNVRAGILVIAGVLCIQFGTAGPFQNVAGILWPLALVFFGAAVTVAIRGTREARRTARDGDTRIP